MQLANKTIFNIRRGLDQRDVALIQKSWAELRQSNLQHILSRELVEQIAQLSVSLLPQTSHAKGWDSDRRSFVEEVALAAAAVHATDALNACLVAYLNRGDSRAVFELHEKFKRLPDAPEPPQVSDLTPIEDNIVASETLPGRASAFLAVVAACAMEDSFQAALKEYIDTDIYMPRHTTKTFLETISRDPTLRDKVAIFVPRLDLAKSVARPHSLSKHIHNLSQQPASPVLENMYNSILEAMAEPDAYIAADPKFITSTKSVAMSEVIWASFLVAFMRRERDDLAAKIWQDMSRFGIQPGIMTWNMVLDAYCDRGATREVLGAWGTMTGNGIKPDALTYRAVISALFAEKRVSDALRWFQRFETDVKPSSSPEQTLPVYNAVLHGMLQLGRENAPHAFSLFKKMEEEGPKPDLVSYNTLMGYHGQHGDFKAMAVIINQMSNAAISGDVYTFSTILSALLKVGRTDAPEMVLGIMRKQGVQASVAIYSAIIDSQMREQTVQHLQAGMRILDEMEKDPRMSPNEITYTSILAGLYRGAWLSADQVEIYRKDIVTRMKRRKIKFKSAGYNILIRTCLASEEPSRLESALAFYRELQRQYTPNEDTWYILLAGLLGRGEWQLAREIVEEMLASGVRPKNSVLRLVNKIRREGR
ncbi:hypothetical protein B0H11DRAFT_1721033 [Mycena galericulata]|nr:hypothetical protein B0H11DRAFT_1721033 [Mycena galericulata]